MKKVLGILLVATAWFSCGPSIKVSQSWVAADSGHKTFHKIIVLVLAPAKYNDAGRIGEEQLVSQLKSNGVNAASAQDAFGPEKFKGNDEQAVLNKMKTSGADAVIVTSLLDVDKEQKYVQGAAWPPTYYGRFWGYYSFWNTRSYDPGYYETTRKYYFETNLYELSDSKLLYSVQSQTTDPGAAETVARVFSERVVKDMKSKQVI